MKTEVVMKKLDTVIRGNTEIELCRSEIPGARPIYHTLLKGNTLELDGSIGCYRIFILLCGETVFSQSGAEHRFDCRTLFIPSPDRSLLLSAATDTALLEIQWDIASEDEALIREYRTEFPIIQKYSESIQYTDPNKSEKTISRMMVPQRVLPRFSIGSVESYGYDLVRSHSHPMLDQFFFSFPENDMNVLINGEPIHMEGNVILHIPLGADHGVEVEKGKHMHYMWIDFLPDNALGLKRLDERHHVTGTMRSFDAEKQA